MVYIISALPALSYCQISISATILSNDEKPIENVTILLKNTTLYSQSDSNGYFTMVIPPNVVESELYLSRVGYNDTTINYNYLISDKVIFLNSSNNLAEVIIKEKKSFLLKNQLRQIETTLIGTNYFSKFCEIQNLDSFVILTNKDHSFKYYSNEPIVIINRALGYKIKAKFGVCTINGRSRRFDIKSVQFIPLEPSNEKENRFFEENREKVFATSYKGFFAALAMKTFSEDFIIYKSITNEPLIYPLFLSEEVKNNKMVFVSPDSIVVTKLQDGKYQITSDAPLFVFSKKENADNSFFYDMRFTFLFVIFSKIL